VVTERVVQNWTRLTAVTTETYPEKQRQLAMMGGQERYDGGAIDTTVVRRQDQTGDTREGEICSVVTFPW
jgi:hypothetical protein